MRPIILFVFAGRRPNMELQLRWARRVLELHPQVVYEVWNLARDPADGEWLRTLSGERLVVRNDFAGQKSGWGMHQVWDHYSHRAYQHTLLVKVDDDLVFLDPNRFSVLVDAAQTHPETIVSADVINNGACNQLHPPLRLLGCGPLQVHASNVCAAAAHEWFLANWEQACAEPMTYMPQRLWCSINAVAMDWRMCVALLRVLNSRRIPPVIAGHRHGRRRMGDEGAANLLPRAIATGVMGAHLSFAPQGVDDDTLDKWRRGYSGVLDRVIRP